MKLERISRVLFAILLAASLAYSPATDASQLMAETDIGGEFAAFWAVARGTHSLLTADLHSLISGLGLKLRLLYLAFLGVFEKS